LQAAATKISSLSSLPQTLQPSEFVIFITRDISNSEFNAYPPADNFRFAVIRREPTPSAEIASYKRTYQALAAFPTYR
jgi:hypothetical protein